MLVGGLDDEDDEAIGPSRAIESKPSVGSLAVFSRELFCDTNAGGRCMASKTLYAVSGKDDGERVLDDRCGGWTESPGSAAACASSLETIEKDEGEAAIRGYGLGVVHDGAKDFRVSSRLKYHGKQWKRTNSEDLQALHKGEMRSERKDPNSRVDHEWIPLPGEHR